MFTSIYMTKTQYATLVLATSGLLIFRPFRLDAPVGDDFVSLTLGHFGKRRGLRESDDLWPLCKVAFSYVSWEKVNVALFLWFCFFAQFFSQSPPSLSPERCNCSWGTRGETPSKWLSHNAPLIKMQGSHCLILGSEGQVRKAKSPPLFFFFWYKEPRLRSPGTGTASALNKPYGTERKWHIWRKGMWNEQLFKETLNKDCDYRTSSKMFTAGANAGVRSTSLGLERKCLNKTLPLFHFVLQVESGIKTLFKKWIYIKVRSPECTQLDSLESRLLVVVVLASLQQGNIFGMEFLRCRLRLQTPRLKLMSDFCCLHLVPGIKSGFASVWINQSWWLSHAEPLDFLLTVIDSPALCLGVWWRQSVRTPEWRLRGRDTVLHPPALRLINAPPTLNHSRYLESRRPVSLTLNRIVRMWVWPLRVLWAERHDSLTWGLQDHLASQGSNKTIKVKSLSKYRCLWKRVIINWPGGAISNASIWTLHAFSSSKFKILN